MAPAVPAARPAVESFTKVMPLTTTEIETIAMFVLDMPLSDERMLIIRLINENSIRRTAEEIERRN